MRTLKRAWYGCIRLSELCGNTKWSVSLFFTKLWVLGLIRDVPFSSDGAWEVVETPELAAVLAEYMLGGE